LFDVRSWSPNEARARRLRCNRVRARAASLAAMQRANLVAVGIAHIGKIELRCPRFTQAGRILDALAAVCDTGIVERLHLFRAVTGTAYRGAVGVCRRRAIDTL